MHLKSTHYKFDLNAEITSQTNIKSLNCSLVHENLLAHIILITMHSFILLFSFLPFKLFTERVKYIEMLLDR